MRMLNAVAVSSIALLCSALSQAQDARPTIDADGTVRGALSTVPMSEYLSSEAKAQLIDRIKLAPSPLADLDAFRKRSDDLAKASLEGWLKIHPAKITSTAIAGVHVDVIEPDAGIDAKNKKRVLINAHMGGFVTGSKYGGQVESVPLAGTGKIKVIAVDYRLAPEAKYPAATEDMEAVYREVLKTTKPQNIGIYGCSAGGTLVAQSMAWFQNKNLPLPGAIGIFCSGAMPTFWYGGDSGAVTPFMNGGVAQRANLVAATRGYFEGVEINDPLVTPGLFPQVLAKFPPTLVVTGTRDIAMSNAVMTHTQLLKAGVRAELFIQEGLGHGHFFSFPGAPESTAAYDVIWSFFDRHLKR
ncbi:MAG: alpha/beta hydrolase [Rhodospirillaceae bacterium]|nr:alpha/beta hydrolase [Rhodospirillaceae bacterium]